MSISQGELKGRILRVLNKTPLNPGFYTDAKVTDAIQECMDSIATDMFIADQGWLTKMAFIDTVAGQVTVPIGRHMSMIKTVSYLNEGNVYSKMTYDDSATDPIYQSASGMTQFGSRYMIVDNQFFFNPALCFGGPRYLMVEYTAFPKIAQDDDEELEEQFNAAMHHLIKYQSATILQASFGKPNQAVEWAESQAMWQAKVTAMIGKRTLQPTAIRDFM